LAGQPPASSYHYFVILDFGLVSYSTIERKEVQMPKYKVTKVYEVEARNKEEAVQKMQNDPDTLMYTSVYLVTDKSWTGIVKEQLTGKK
jgi:hypothetical protein